MRFKCDVCNMYIQGFLKKEFFILFLYLIILNVMALLFFILCLDGWKSCGIVDVVCGESEGAASRGACLLPLR